MASPAYLQLLVVQGHDTSLDVLRHKHATHQLRTDIANFEAQIAESDVVIGRMEEARHELDRQRKRLDDEAATVQAKRDKIQVQLYDGSVTATKDLLALQDEAKSLAGRQSGIEDEELEFMEQIETASSEIEAAVAAKGDLVNQMGAAQTNLETALAEIDSEIASESALRLTAAEAVPSEVLKAYEKLRGDMGGVAIAKLVGSTCDGCHMTLSAVALDRANKAGPDDIVNCVECGRLLVV